MSSRTTSDRFSLVPLDFESSQLQVPFDPAPLPLASVTTIALKKPLFNRRTGALAGAAIAVVGGTSLVQLAHQPTQYEGKFQLLVEPNVDTGDSTTQAAQATQTSVSIDYATQIQVLWSPKLLAPVVEQLETQYADLTYDTLAQKLAIAHRDGEKTLEITYQDTDPAKVQAVLATVSHAYQQYSQSCRTSLCRERQFVEQRLPHLQQQVTVAQQNLQTLRQQHGTVDPARLGQQLSQRSSVLTQQRQDLQTRLLEARTQLAILQARMGSSDAALAAVLNRNDRYQSLQQQLQAIANQLTVELARPQANSATLQSLKQRYQLVAAQMTQAAQQPIAPPLAQAIANFQAQKTTDYTAVIQQQTLMEWVTAATEVQVLTVSEQAIVQTEGRIQQQIQQWAVLARQDAALNLELKFATDNLNLYKAKHAELQQMMPPKTDWQLLAKPMVAPIASISDPDHRLSLGLSLSFLLVILVLSIAEQTRPNRATRRSLSSIQPESLPQTAFWQASWQATLEQPSLLLPAIALSERSLQHKRTTLFLLTAAVRMEARRTKLTV